MTKCEFFTEQDRITGFSVSGHSGYSKSGNSMTKKNWSRVEHLTCSDTLKGYFAAQLELEDALCALVRQLEEAVRLDALPRKKVSRRMDPEVRRTASAIRSKLRAKVAIEGDQEKGKIIISYFSRDDLMNICDAILGVEE